MSFEVIVYDKAKYHYEGRFPKDLSIDQASYIQACFWGGSLIMVCSVKNLKKTLRVKFKNLNHEK